jgi:hypothetical protein
MACRCCADECETEDDCYYFVVGSTGYGNPGCPAESLYVYFDNFDAAAEYALPLAENENCGAPVIDSVYGKCCENSCFPPLDALPYFTNSEPAEVECP